MACDGMAGQAPVKKVYRGQENGVNWASSDNEIASVLRVALEKAADQAVVDVQRSLAQR